MALAKERASTFSDEKFVSRGRNNNGQHRNSKKGEERRIRQVTKVGSEACKPEPGRDENWQGQGGH